MDKKSPQRYDAEVAEMALNVALEQVEFKKAQMEMAQKPLSGNDPEEAKPESKGEVEDDG